MSPFLDKQLDMLFHELVPALLLLFALILAFGPLLLDCLYLPALAENLQQLSRAFESRRRPSDRRLRYSPRLGAKAWNADAASGAGYPHRRFAERGARDEPSSEGSAAPDEAGGRAGLPRQSDHWPGDATVRVTATEVQPRGNQLSGLSFVR
jgi:hypothetical protein